MKPQSGAGDKGSVLFEDFNRPGFDGWFVSGDAFGAGLARRGLSGEFRACGFRRTPPTARPPFPRGQRIAGSFPTGSRACRGRSFTIEKPFIQYLAAGRAGRLNVVVDGFEKIRDPIYGGLTLEVNSGDEVRWHAQNVAMWDGHRAYIEISDGATVELQRIAVELFRRHRLHRRR